MNRDEILRIADEVREKTQRDTATADIEAVIAQVKNGIYKKVQDELSTMLLVALMAKEEKPPVYARGHVAFQIAECAEIIMRRAWIEEA